MKYDKETTIKLVSEYEQLVTENSDKKWVVKTLAERFSVPERSIRAKLSSMNLYRRANYLDKRGNTPIKKEEYIERIAAKMQVNVEILESLEKCNKSVLILLEDALK